MLNCNPQFLPIDPISCEKVIAKDVVKPQFHFSFADRPSFRATRLLPKLQTGNNYFIFCRSTFISCDKSRRRSSKLAILCFFWPIGLHFVRKGYRRAIIVLTSVFADRPSFRAKGLLLKFKIGNLILLFADRPSFRAKGLHVGLKREDRKKKKEKETEREREGERERERSCEDVKMICADVKVWRWYV